MNYQNTVKTLEIQKGKWAHVQAFPIIDGYAVCYWLDKPVEMDGLFAVDPFSADHIEC